MVEFERASSTVEVRRLRELQDEKIDALILPGLPGVRDTLDSGEGAYPSSTTDIMKLLRSKGARVEHDRPKEERADVLLKANDVWVPVLAFTANALATGAGSLLAEAILVLFGGRARSGQLHVTIGVESKGKTEFFQAHGRGEDVLEALREFRTK